MRQNIARCSAMAWIRSGSAGSAEEAAIAASRAISFRDRRTAYIEAHAPSWRNAKHKTQWENTLSTYAYPVMGNLTVSDIGTDHALRVFEPTGTRSARLRGVCGLELSACCPGRPPTATAGTRIRPGGRAT